MAGVVTLLFTDLAGSSGPLGERNDAGEQVRRRHFRVLRDAVTAAGAAEVRNLGDGLVVAFASPAQGVACAVAVQQAIAVHNDKRGGPPLGVRVGLHAGEPTGVDDGDGPPVAIARRLCDAAAGGQILASDLVRGLLGPRGEFVFHRRGPVPLPGLAEPVPAYEVGWAPAPAAGPAPPDPRRARLVGRAAELAALQAELELAAAGRLRAVLLAGDAGIGKTRLAAELAARCGAGATVLNARAYPLGATASLGLWVEALEGPPGRPGGGAGRPPPRGPHHPAPVGGRRRPVPTGGRAVPGAAPRRPGPRAGRAGGGRTGGGGPRRRPPGRRFVVGGPRIPRPSPGRRPPPPGAGRPAGRAGRSHHRHPDPAGAGTGGLPPPADRRAARGGRRGRAGPGRDRPSRRRRRPGHLADGTVPGDAAVRRRPPPGAPRRRRRPRPP